MVFIILGEKYWFNNGPQYKKAKFLFDYLNRSEYNFEIFRNINDFFKYIKNNSDNIQGILMYSDIISDSFLLIIKC